MKSRGRPKGSSSFAGIKMKDLNKVFGPDAIIQISRVWWDGMTNQELEIVEAAPVKQESSVEMLLRE